MATAVQVQYRRGSSTAVASYTGPQGEMVVDTTDNRVVIQDGSTAGGWPAAKLSEVQTNTRTQVSDGNYTAQITDRLIAYIALTASRTVSLPAASTYPSGSRLLVVDESGNCAATKTITLSANGSDLIDGAASAVIGTTYGYIALECNAANKWTIVDQVGSTLNGLQGALTLAATDGTVIAASGTTVSIGGPGGTVNKFRNGTMDVWQRGTSPSLAAGTSGSQYSADGWLVTWSASSAAAPAVSQAGGRLITKNSLELAGAAAITDLGLAQRIESSIAAALCGQTVTVQAQIYNGSGGSITPTLTVKRPSTQDGWSGTVNTDVNAVNLQSCPANSWTLVAYTFSANAACYNGLQIGFDFGNNFAANSKTVQITECDIRVTPGASVGVSSNPPPPELRPIAMELALCQRYYEVLSYESTGYTFITFLYSTTEAMSYWYFHTTKRAVPTFAVVSGSWQVATPATSPTVDYVRAIDTSVSGGGPYLSGSAGAIAASVSAEL